jgi:hypothetical protein
VKSAAQWPTCEGERGGSHSCAQPFRGADLERCPHALDHSKPQKSLVSARMKWRTVFRLTSSNNTRQQRRTLRVVNSAAKLSPEI